MSSDTPTIEFINEVIARFMGGEVMDDYTISNYTKIGIPKWAFRIYDFDTIRVGGYEYNTSWDWLMPVIEKISKIPLLNADDTPCTDPQDVCYTRTFGMPTEDGKNVMVRFNAAICCEAPTLLEAAYMAVYDFIKM